MWKWLLRATVETVLPDGAGSLARQVADHFTEHGQIVEQSLRESNDQAWRTLEIALAEPSTMGGLKKASPAPMKSGCWR